MNSRVYLISTCSGVFPLEAVDWMSHITLHWGHMLEIFRWWKVNVSCWRWFSYYLLLIRKCIKQIWVFLFCVMISLSLLIAMVSKRKSHWFVERPKDSQKRLFAKRNSAALGLIHAPGGITFLCFLLDAKSLVVSNVKNTNVHLELSNKNLPWIQQVAISLTFGIQSPWKLDAFLKRSQQKPFRDGEGIPHSHSVYHGGWHHHGGGPGRALAIASEGLGRCKWHRCDTIVHCCETWANRAGEALIGSTSWCWYLVHQHVLSSVTTCVVTVVFTMYMGEVSHRTPESGPAMGPPSCA